MANQSLIPMFSIADIAKRIDEFAEAKVQKSIETLHYVGEDYVNKARDLRTYLDHTGNLRSSIGYVVLFNGKSKDLFAMSAEKDDNAAGMKQARKFAKEIGQQFNQGLVLVVFAGMEYAAAVESLGYDVITGSQPMAASLLAELKRELQ